MILMHDFLHDFFFSNFDQLGPGQIFQKGNGSWIDDSDAAILLLSERPTGLVLGQAMSTTKLRIFFAQREHKSTQEPGIINHMVNDIVNIWLLYG